jgi:2-C-methyl-D-erythritol 4-phosphate cytidylyltransferase
VHQADHMALTGGLTETDVIVVAAGKGERLGRGPKALVRLAGRPLLAWALESVLANACVRDVIVVANSRALEESVAVCSRAADANRVRVVTGGPDRQQSSSRGLTALRQGTTQVAVTDAVRPMVPAGTIDRLSEQLTAAGRKGFSAVVPAVPVFETVRRTSPDGTSLGTVNRDELRAVQTPEIFCRQCLEKAMTLALDSGEIFTDDAGLIEHYGGKVLLSPGDPINRKITIEHDLFVAEALLRMAAFEDNQHLASATAERPGGVDVQA